MTMAAMAQVTVQLDEDHLERLIKTPVVGLAELVWNALDADATEIDCRVTVQDMGGPETVVIKDNGLGMDHEEASGEFGALGGSWKRTQRQTRRDQRIVHGSKGEGRYAAFAIGGQVTWRSVHANTDGTRSEITIVGRRNALKIFDITDPLPTSGLPGTEVRVDLLDEKSIKAFDKTDDIADQLAVLLALYMEQYPVTVTWQGTPVSPSDLQAHRATYELEVPEAEDAVTLNVIEWNKPFPRSLWLCDDQGFALYETQPAIHAPGFDFTAYLQWSGFRDVQRHDLALAELGQKDLAPVLEAARDKLRTHFRERASLRQRTIIDRWKRERSYPYPDDQPPRNGLQRAERDLFEVVAVTAAKTIDAGEVDSRRLSLRLLREAVETKPSALRRIIGEVIQLPPARQEELNQLLDRTPLNSIIAASKTVTDRLDFLSALDTMLFDPEPKAQLLERRQLHRILAAETWLFGEEYALTGDDERLTAVLKRHLAMLGEDTELLVDEPAPAREDGREVIPDLVLSRKLLHHENELQHLVIELKRPSVDIGLPQLRQIQDYALTVARDDRFNQDNVHWDFWIIGNALTPDVQRLARQSGRAHGVVQEDENLRLWAKTWAEIIQDAKHRLKFVQQSLDYNSTRDSGLAYLRATHAKYLPEALEGDPVDRPEDTTAAVSDDS